MPLHLDLFSGIGGFGLAARWAGYETVGFCEVDPWCQKVLRKHWPEAPIHGDVRTLTGDIVRGWVRERPARIEPMAHAESDARGSSGPKQGQAGTGVAPDHRGEFRDGIDLLTGGFPCQPFSVAGKQLGAQDDRHLWPEMLRLIDELRPARILGENVAGLISMGLDEVLSDLEALGYACWPVVIPAAAVGAPHRRDRVWILADAERGRRREPMRTDPAQGALPETFGGEGAFGAGSSRADVADAPRIGEREPADETNAVAAGGHAWQESRGGSDGGGGILPNALSIGQPGPWAREYASDQAPDGDWQAGDVVDAGAAGTGTEALGGLGDTADGLPGRVARSGWRVGAGVLNPWSSDWEAGCSRVVGHETDRVNKLKALGNAIVPQVAYEILHAWEAA